MNLNKGCIEIFNYGEALYTEQLMNLNKGCIEIDYRFKTTCRKAGMNLNKGCIEIPEKQRQGKAKGKDEP